MSITRLALALVIAAATASAADPLTADFKACGKQAVKLVKTAIKETTKAVKSELKAAAKGYGDGATDADAALTAALDAMTFYRDTVADSANEAVGQLVSQGLDLLITSGLPAAPPDFQAGGRGVWDDTLRDIEEQMDKADAKFEAAFAKFVKDMGKSAKKLDAVIDIRWRVPAHGDEFWAVVPPMIAKATLGQPESTTPPPPQVLIEARIQETNLDDSLAIGGRFNEPTVGVIVSSGVGEALELGSLLAGGGDTGIGTFPLAGIQNPDSYINLALAGISDKSTLETLSAPRITSAGAAIEPIVKDFKADLKDSKLALAEACADAIGALNTALDSHVKAVSKDQASVELALRTGLGNLATARETMAVALQQSRNNAVSLLKIGLSTGGFDDEDLPADVAPDALGVYADAADAQAEKLAKCQDQASKSYDNFIDKLKNLANKKDETVGINAVIGRTHGLAPPMVSTAGSPPVQSPTSTHITDGIVLTVHPAVGPDQSSVFLVVQSDPALETVSAGALTLPEGDTLLLGGLTLAEGGTASDEIPVLADIPLLGWLFSAKADSESHADLMVIMKPDIIGVDEN